MVQADNHSWNIRDHHMDTVLTELRSHFHGKKAIVWEHNTHVGDARATDMPRAGLTNVGQLSRERYGQESLCIVGFGSYMGSVIAARNW